MGNGTDLGRQSGPPFRLFIRHHLSPGDVMAMTAAVESLHRAYPGEYLTNVETTCQDIWRNNPRIKTDLQAHQCHVMHLEYPAIHTAGKRHVHFMHGFCEDLAAKIKRPVPLLVNRPCLYLDDHERTRRLPGTEGIGPYVVVNAGRKSDFTAKWAGSVIWQDAVRKLRDERPGVAVVQIGENNPSHHHPPLDGVVNLIGKTSARDLFRLVHHSVGAAGPVTFLHHVAAALNRPYVCLAGGREEMTWEAYGSTVYLHTIGQLECCREKACWKSRTVPLKDGSHNDASLCKLPVIQPDGEAVPRCLVLVGSDRVAQSLIQIMDAAAT